tara:strand:- start:336 stop:638 length:303 start_codon:yes stop_codon:yes gene_type:complete
MDRNIIETKIAELETAKKNKSVAEGAIISAQADLEKATQEVENLSDMVKGLKLLIAENEYEQTGCRIPFVHTGSFYGDVDCECKTTYHKQSAELYFSKAD